MRRTAPFLLVICAALLGVGCGARKDLASTDLAVAKFHTQLDAASFAQIYSDSSEAMKNASPKEKFVAFLDAVHRKLGAVKSTSRKGFFINWGTSGKTVKATYSTQFDQDNAEEQFVFQVRGDDVQLVGYHINSDALVTK